ncbi:MAG TPA: cyclopropane-fatty-acyl-phospholipid synthase family protein [Beijerinckiaceae bacterium]|jgi:cyclopropane-fatty-acyl-phospholipid synthase
MSLIAAAARAAERAPLPDALTLFGIDVLVGRTRRKLAQMPPDAEQAFARAMDARAIAEHVKAANDQHYELPAAFFGAVLGPRRKYSCCLYEDGGETLEEAERKALDATIAHADLRDGQRILELGCGWGSLTLLMAERFPHARITAVSNSHSQRAYIAGRAEALGLANVVVTTADMNAFETQAGFDRIVSVEMFEHMSNWRALLTKARGWLAPEGLLFLHVFSHRAQPYRFETDDEADWIAQHFFTGGVMPSHGLIRQFGDLFDVAQEWRWSGEHYRRTAMDWLDAFDSRLDVVEPLMAETYGVEAALWMRRWRLFFLATAGLFGHRGGEEWGVSHYLLRPARTG